MGYKHMRDKKKSEPKKTPEQEALERHVDAMMDPEQPDEAPTALAPKPAATGTPKITAVAAPAAEPTKTAPQLSPNLRKQITVTDASTKPLSIDKLDELAEQITKSETPKKKSKKSTTKTETPEEPEEAPAPETEPEDITEQSTDLDDTRTDEAVQNIVAYEGDVMLAVADSTAEERNRQAGAVADEHRGHPIFSTIFWTLIALVAILIIALGALLFMGDSVTSKLGL
jgi:hypothetical protein